MKKAAKFEWTEECAEAFDKIKVYLANPPCLTRRLPRDTLILYLAAAHHVVSAALIREEGKEQKPVYFVSHILRDAETRYPLLEKAAFALIIAARKLKPYFQAHPIHIRTNVPLKKAMTNFDSSGRLLSWAVELSEFDISFYPLTAQKSQILADFIADYSGQPEEGTSVWTLHVDGASSKNGSGAGVALEGPCGEVFNYALKFLFLVTNNIAEYEAMIVGLQLAKEVRAREVCLKSDSQLVVKQIEEEIRVPDDKLIPYRDKFCALREAFDKVTVIHVPRSQNSQADALSKLGAIGNLDKEWPVIIKELPVLSLEAKPLVMTVEILEDTWYSPIWKYLVDGTLPEEHVATRRIKQNAPRYAIINQNLYKRGHLLPWLKCVGENKAKELLAEVHEGIYGSYKGARTLAARVLRAGFYWPTLKSEAKALVAKCE